MSLSPALILALACVLMSCVAQLCMRQGMLLATQTAASQQLGAVYWAAVFQPWVWLGLSLYAFSALAWLWVLSRVPVSTAYPLVSLGFVLTVAGGIWWLGEPFSWLKVTGCVLIVLGVALLCVDWQQTLGRLS
jgi:multidrug transporter EmrE-like cation transporter